MYNHDANYMQTRRTYVFRPRFTNGCANNIDSTCLGKTTSRSCYIFACCITMILTLVLWRIVPNMHYPNHVEFPQSLITDDALLLLVIVFLISCYDIIDHNYVDL